MAAHHAQIGPASSRRVLGFAPAARRGAGEFIALVAHELRNPLAPLKNVAALLKRATLDVSALQLAAKIIDRQVSVMTLLIDDLLQAPRLAAGKFQVRRTPTALSEILERTLETACPIVAERGHTLSMSVPPEPIILKADAMRLSQVFHNLIVNAAKYTNPGGRIRIDVRRDGNDVVVIVGDTGIGIAPAQINAIFDLYTQVATERSAGGVGIGLYVARSLVDAHGGTLRAVSQGPGQGSEFIVRLPCASSSRPPVEGSALADVGQLQAWENEGGQAKCGRSRSVSFLTTA